MTMIQDVESYKWTHESVLPLLAENDNPIAAVIGRARKLVLEAVSDGWASAALNGPTDIALTFADYHTIMNRKARRFDQLHVDTIRFVEEVEKVAGAPVSLIASRFHSRSIIDRRAW
jgi:adenylosuccinate synthase